jgi:DNA-binding CsgD family transcriptional regulator
MQDELGAVDVRVMRTHLLMLSRLIALGRDEFDSLDELLQQIVKLIRSEMRYDHFAIGLLDDAGILRFRAGYGIAESHKRTLTVVRGQGIVGRVLASNEPVIVLDVQTEPHYRNLVEGTRSELCVPLQTVKGVIGVINAESMVPNAFNEHDMELLTTVADSVSGLVARWMKQEHTEREPTARLMRLTPREKQVLQALMRGKSNAQIAHVLKIQVHTVEHHITAILKKLELTSRHEAAEWARQNRVFENS